MFASGMDCRYNDELNWKTGDFKTECVWISFPKSYLHDNVKQHCEPDGYAIALGLVHELIHIVHYIEGNWSMRARSSLPARLSKEFTDLEEQLTICGVENKTDTIRLCENAFVEAFGYNFRTSHRSHPEKL